MGEPDDYEDRRREIRYEHFFLVSHIKVAVDQKCPNLPDQDLTD
jgi:hypothetical protein